MAYRFTSTHNQLTPRSGSQKQKALTKYGRSFICNLEDAKRRSGRENLRLAADREEQKLAFVDAVCILDGRIHVSDAGPVGRVAELGLGDL